jgi:type VI secretion system secreted protein VgrG
VKAPAVYVRLATDAPDAAPSLIKLAPHMQTVPEPGVTVLVTRAQDESELPEIQSIIHTNGSKVVMPSGWTANSHVGSSYNTSYGDGMSIRFGSSSQQQLDFAITRVNAAYDTKKYRETSYAQGASYGYNCADQVAPAASDDAELFGKYPGASDILSASESFGSNYSRHHAQVVSSYSKIGTMYNVSVTGLSESHSTVTGKTTSTALHQDDVSSTTTMNADSSNVATHLGDVDSVSSHLGDVSSINTILGSSVNVSTIVGVNASMSNHGVVLSNNNTLVQGSVNLTGVTGAMNSTGVSTHSNDTLVSIGDNFTGVQSDTTVIGAQSTTSTVLAQSTMNWVGASSTINLEGPGIHYNNKAEKVGAATQDIDVITIVVMQIYL